MMADIIKFPNIRRRVPCAAPHCKNIVKVRSTVPEDTPVFCDYDCAIIGQPKYVKGGLFNLRGQGE